MLPPTRIEYLGWKITGDRSDFSQQNPTIIYFSFCELYTILFRVRDKFVHRINIEFYGLGEAKYHSLDKLNHRPSIFYGNTILEDTGIKNAVRGNQLNFFFQHNLFMNQVFGKTIFFKHLDDFGNSEILKSLQFFLLCNLQTSPWPW